MMRAARPGRQLRLVPCEAFACEAGLVKKHGPAADEQEDAVTVGLMVRHFNDREVTATAVPSKVTAKVSKLRLIRTPGRYAGRPCLRAHGASVRSLFTVPPAVSAEC